MKLLLLAGTTEARKIAEAIDGMEGMDLIASYSGAVRTPSRLPCRVRSGGFGGVAGLRAYLRREGIGAVLDATHPFAAGMSANAIQATRAEGVSHLQILRPEWRPGDGDAWIMIDAEERAADHVAPGSRVFLATGGQRLERFANLAGCRLICRRIDPPDTPFPFPIGEYLIARPPFTPESELALFAGLGLDWLVVRNSGGAEGRAKLEAARRLGLRVLMIRRPAPADCARVESVGAALDWVGALAGRGSTCGS